MGEALLIKTGGTSSGGSSGRNGLITEIFTSNTLWKVPEGIRSNEVSVRIFGGGGSGQGIKRPNSPTMGGYGGSMNNAIIDISNDEEIFITIGDGGFHNYSNPDMQLNPGTTSFGTYLSALGGLGSGGGGSSEYGSSYGYQFGGGAGLNTKLSKSGGNGSNFAGGGGGGYGGDGGDAYYMMAGGGGGYGKKGKGGHFDPVNNCVVPPGIAAGSSCADVNGGSGICIIQYYLD